MIIEQPGEEPFTRGLHKDGYKYTMRQLSGSGSPQYINERIRWLLKSGATGINLLPDLATIQMYDSDEPEAKGQVGTVGVPIDCVEDMETIYKDIPIEKVSSSIVTHYPRNTAILFPMYLVMAEKRGIPWDVLRGSVQNDFIMESVVRSGPEYIPPRDVFRIQCDNIGFIVKNMPKWNHITLNGYNLREAGTSMITELAVAMANGIETLGEMGRRHFYIDDVAPRMAFFLCVGNDFFSEIARLRAARRLWHDVIKHGFKAKNPRSMWFRCHVQTSGISLQRIEPMNNVVRVAYQALAAILGGAQSLHADSYDEAYSTPSEEAALLSLRTQQIIEAETAITKVADPLGGSYYIETLTNEIESEVLKEISEIKEVGGMVHAAENGWLHRKIANYIHNEPKKVVVGDPDSKEPDIKMHQYSEELREEMCVKLEKHREDRDVWGCQYALVGLREACQRGFNIMDWSIASVRAGATEGEMRRVFMDAFGSWSPPSLI